MRKIVNTQSYIKYKRFLKNRRVMRDQNLFFCPVAGCEKDLDLRSAKGSFVNCSRCKNDICAKCKKKHDGLETTCENAKFNEDDGLQKWI